MKAAELVAMYERVADAPDAVQKLRRFVLELAVRGKLESQKPADDAATIGLPSPALGDGGSRGAKSEAPAGASLLASSAELGFNLPTGWVAARLHQVAECLDYMRRPINAADRDKRTAGKAPDELFPYYGATQQQGWIDDFLFDEELLLLGEDGIPFFDPYRSKAYLVSGRTWVNNHAHVFRCTSVLPRFLMHHLNTFDYTGRVVGATRAKLNQAAALDIPIPLPPMSEQHRIVAKVDELMALCDQLEAARKEREAARDRLAAASLARLSAPDPGTFQADARFALDVLPELSARPDQIKQLRKTILDLAIRGALVHPLDMGANTARSSDHIQTAQDGVPAPFGLPRGWGWTRLGDIGSWGAGSTPSRSKDGLYGGNISWFKSGELNDSRALVGSAERITRQALESGTFRRNRSGDVLIAMYGATIGKVAILAEPAVTNQAVCGCTPNPNVLNTFLYYFLLSQRDNLQAASEGGAQPNISKAKIIAMPFPLPPLSEQKEIVSKLDALMLLCDKFEAALTNHNRVQGGLLDALLSSLLTIPFAP